MLIRALSTFTGLSKQEVWSRITRGKDLSDEAWQAFAHGRPPERIPAQELRGFYGTTDSYLWDLAQWHMGAKRLHDEVVARQLHEAGIRTVLDFGAGIGSNAIAFARRGLEVTAVELTGTTGDFLRHRLLQLGTKVSSRVRLVLAPDPVEWLERQERPWDAVYCSDVLEHLASHQEALRVARMLRRLAKRACLLQASFGDQNSPYPQHLAQNDEVAREIERLSRGEQDGDGG